ncbi:MAG: hypothetical protein AAB289_12910, partial [Chloroflexota bacterium]
MSAAAARTAQKPTPELGIVVLDPDADRALRTVTELRTLSTLRLLVVGPANDPRLVLQSLRLGASDFVDAGELETELTAALARLQGELGPRNEPAQLIALLAPSGGSGSSTLAASVATVLAQQHTKTLLVDLKLETRDLAALLDLRPTHSLAAVCQNMGHMDLVMFERCLAPHARGVSLLAPPSTYADLSHVTAEGVRQALALARNLFPYVVVDLDHTFRDEQVQALRLTDTILLVFRLDFASLRNANRTMEHLDRLGIRKDSVRLVVNRYGQAQEVPGAKAEEALGMKIFHFVPEDAKTVN